MDVNIHPTKKEVRFREEKSVYELFYHAIKDALDRITLIPEESLSDRTETVVVPEKKAPEPFERERSKREFIQHTMTEDIRSDNTEHGIFKQTTPEPASKVQETGAFLHGNVFREEESEAFRVIGQVFDTYWLIEYKDELLIIDQHAAHEKVLYERFVAKMKNKTGLSQKLLAPIVISLSGREQEVLTAHADAFHELGFEWENFGDTEFLLQAVPTDFLSLDVKEVFIDILDSLMDGQKGKKPEMILDRLATISCKAAVKGNNTLSLPEIKTLIREMLSLEEPYHCPHGRPTTIALSKYEFEKKFKRQV